MEENKITKKEVVKKIISLRQIAEVNIVSSLYKKQDLFFMYDELNEDMFKDNKCKVYYIIGRDIVVKEGKTLDEIGCLTYLEKHPKLAKKWEEFNGNDIFKTGEYVNEDDIQSYINDIIKYDTLIKMMKEGIGNVKDNFSTYLDLSLEDIYAEIEAKINHIFIDATSSSKDKAYKLCSGIEALIDDMNSGIEIGMPFYGLDLLTKETSGILNGQVYLFSALSGVGKSSFCRNTIIGSALINERPLVLMINEEDLSAVQKNMLVWVANNIYKKDVTKYKLKNGGYSPEFIRFLKEDCAKWLKEREDYIIVIPFSSYTCSKAIKVIRKYSMIFKDPIFILDTMKQSSDSKGEAWATVLRDSVDLYDTIKPSSLNVPLVITAQLNKTTASRSRALNQSDLSLCKGILDICSVAGFMRTVGIDEMEGGKNEIKCFRMKGNTKIPVKLDPNQNYVVMTLTKNRFGSTNLSVVFKNDLSRNVVEEIGYCICVDNMI